MAESAGPSEESPGLVEVVRSGVVEGGHRGRMVVVDQAGAVRTSVGDSGSVLLPRSCLKPVQAVGMVEHGLDLPPELLAVACASHSGQRRHVERVRRILTSAGLTEDALGNPPDWPLEDRVRDKVLRAGGGPTRALMNCSGKHAAMLVTCVVNGWDVEGYLAPEHPLQRAMRSTVERLAGPVTAQAVDGCGAPLFGVTLEGLARSFVTLAQAEDGPEAQVARAIRARPDLVSGSRRDERRLLTAIPGSIGKAGAEACYVVAVPDRGAVALKIEDGGIRARPVVMAATLEAWGLLDDPGVDRAAVATTGTVRLPGGDGFVGSLVPTPLVTAGPPG